MVYSLTGDRLTIWIVNPFVTAFTAIRELAVDNRTDEGKLYVAKWGEDKVGIFEFRP